MNKLSLLRDEIADIDYQIFNLVSKRCLAAKKIGKYKFENQLPIRNYQLENLVLKRSRNFADSFSLSRQFAEKISRLLISEAVTIQKQYYNKTNRIKRNLGKNCLIIGGAGKMGTWLVDFLQTSGHQVKIVDPAIKQESSICAELPYKINQYDVIIISTPLDILPEVITEIVEKNPSGLVFDIGSLKSGISRIIIDAVKKGIKIASCHPMFGPNINTLSGRNLIICKSGSLTAEKELRDLFNETALNIVEISIDEHDRYMALTLGLVHAINFVFGDMLESSGIKYNNIIEFGGTTFLNQVKTTQEIFNENPRLYHWIQFLNKYKSELYKSFLNSVKKLNKISDNKEQHDFIEFMNSVNNYFQGGDSK